jgi:thiosulfate dehydrogenase (quinone) large subunit
MITASSFIHKEKFAFRERPLQAIGIALFLIGRTIYAIFFLYGFWHKLTKEWLWTDIVQEHFMKRLSEIDASSFQGQYLTHFAIPFYMPVSWVVTVGELIIGVGLLVGLATRANAAFALFLVLNFAAGAFFNATLPPFMVYAVLMMMLPSGHWLGFDKELHERSPNSIWFK